MICLSRSKLQKAALQRPPGYLEDILGHATFQGDKVCFDDEIYAYLRNKYLGSLVEPTVTELAGNFVEAIRKWALSGFPVASEEIYAERAAICGQCEFWDGAARAGLGQCTAPGCGCTRFKRFLATERCPLGKWPR